MEQRIERYHRLGRENDVLSLAFINPPGTSTSEQEKINLLYRLTPVDA